MFLFSLDLCHELVGDGFSIRFTPLVFFGTHLQRSIFSLHGELVLALHVVLLDSLLVAEAIVLLVVFLLSLFVFCGHGVLL